MKDGRTAEYYYAALAEKCGLGQQYEKKPEPVVISYDKDKIFTDVIKLWMYQNC